MTSALLLGSYLAHMPAIAGTLQVSQRWQGADASTTSVRREQSQFSLTILQKKGKLSNVIARVSLKPKQGNSFLTEQFVGDFQYKLKSKNQTAKFVKGLYAGDRVVVRLFTPQNQIIGYSEFELVAGNAAVTLVLPDRTRDYGIVRTVYGVDTDQDYSIDRRVAIYDYFTQVSQVQRFSTARVTFWSSVQSLYLNAFDVSDLPSPRSNCIYPQSFQGGSFSLVNQVIQMFSVNLPSALIQLPSQIVQVINVSSTTISTYTVNQLIVTYRNVGVVQGTVVSVEDDDDDHGGHRKKPHKRHCNQGIGNGSEGCDPGNSRPHGGSNDEGDRKSGGRSR